MDVTGQIRQLELAGFAGDELDHAVALGRQPPPGVRGAAAGDPAGRPSERGAAAGGGNVPGPRAGMKGDKRPSGRFLFFPEDVSGKPRLSMMPLCTA